MRTQAHASTFSLAILHWHFYCWAYHPGGQCDTWKVLEDNWKALKAMKMLHFLQAVKISDMHSLCTPMLEWRCWMNVTYISLSFSGIFFNEFLSMNASNISISGVFLCTGWKDSKPARAGWHIFMNEFLWMVFRKEFYQYFSFYIWHIFMHRVKR